MYNVRTVGLVLFLVGSIPIKDVVSYMGGMSHSMHHSIQYLKRASQCITGTLPRKSTQVADNDFRSSNLVE